jgi:ubiquitin
MESPRFSQDDIITIKNKQKYVEDLTSFDKSDAFKCCSVIESDMALRPMSDFACLELNFIKTETIHIKTMTGKTIQFDINRLDTVDSLNKFISEREGVPVDQQRLIFAGKQLESGHFLSDYNIKNGDSVSLVLRLRGGMHHKTSNGGVTALEQNDYVEIIENCIEQENDKTERELMIELLMGSFTTDEEFDLIDMCDNFRVEDD